MTKLDMLWVRACKSKNPQKRLRSVYRRFYDINDFSRSDESGLAFILINIAEKYISIPLHRVIEELNPQSQYDNPTYYGKVILFITSKLRLSKATVYKGYIAPRRFR